MISILGGPTTGPHAINGQIVVKIYEAKDTSHKPTEAYRQDTYDALDRFETEYSVTMSTYLYLNHWDASDESSNTYNVLCDLRDDEGSHQSAENIIILGWAHNLVNNGMAFGDGFFAVSSDTADGVEWPHDSLVQHEVSHLFNAPEGGYDPLHPNCVMSYYYAAAGTHVWCSSCSSIVNANIWGS